MNTLTYRGTGPKITSKQFVKSDDGSFVLQYQISKPKLDVNRRQAPSAQTMRYYPINMLTHYVQRNETGARYQYENVSRNNGKMHQILKSPCMS